MTEASILARESSANTAKMSEECNDLKDQLRTQEASAQYARQESRLQLVSFKSSDSCLIGALQPRLDSHGPSRLMEYFAARILSKCVKAKNGTVSLHQARGRSVLYKEVERTRALKRTVLPRSSKERIRRNGNAVMAMLMPGENETTPSKFVVNTMKYVAKQHGYIMVRKTKFGLTVPEVLAMRDHMKVSTNTLHRMKQAVETFAPLLRGFIPTAIRQKVSEL